MTLSGHNHTAARLENSRVPPTDRGTNHAETFDSGAEPVNDFETVTIAIY